MWNLKTLVTPVGSNVLSFSKRHLTHRYVKLPLVLVIVFLLYSPIRWGWKKSFGINEALFQFLLSVKSKQKTKKIKNVDFSLDALVGRDKGIQGSNNSCYLDALLFSMFYATNAFKGTLLANDKDTDIARNTRQVLKDCIFQPLRSQERFCSANDMMKLRNLLRKYDPKIMGSFQAVEDVVYLMFEKILHEDKLIQYKDDVDGYMHVILADTSSRNLVTSIQNVFEKSMMLYGDLIFKFVPSPSFILSWPFHKNKLFHYEAIFPVFELDITLKITSEKCTSCGKNAVWETIPLRHNIQGNITSYFCSDHIKNIGANMTCVSRTKMQLTSVMCFRGAHFTSYVRDCISGKDRWLHFDSMMGSTSEVKDVTEVLLKYYDHFTNTSLVNTLPYEIHGFFNDAHTCIYEPIYYHTSYEKLIKSSK